MDTLLDNLVALGPWGVVVAVLVLLRGEVMKLFRGNTSDTEMLIRAMRELRDAVHTQTTQFEKNNGLFEDVLKETSGIRQGIGQLLVESVRGKQ